MMVELMRKLVDVLDATLFYSYEEIFNEVCKEFNLDADSIASALGCRCPFGLIGYVEGGGLED